MCTSAIIVVTVLFMGGSTVGLLKALRIKTGDVPSKAELAVQVKKSVLARALICLATSATALLWGKDSGSGSDGGSGRGSGGQQTLHGALCEQHETVLRARTGVSVRVVAQDTEAVDVDAGVGTAAAVSRRTTASSPKKIVV